MKTLTDPNNVLGEWIIDSEDSLKEWSDHFIGKIPGNATVLLYGEMGSGKTTLVGYVMKALQGDEVSSPTFSLVNEYRYPGGLVFHFDLYRLDEPEELDEIGFEEYLDRDSICLIEWPALGLQYYRDDETTSLQIEVLPEGRRKIKWLNQFEL